MKLKRRLDDSLASMEQMRKKLKYQRQKNQRLGKKVKSVQSIVASLRKDNLVSETCSAQLENITSGVPLEVLKRMQRNNSEKLNRDAYHPELVKFALTLQLYSTQADEYVRKHFNLALPHVATIRRWNSAIDGNPGFTQDAFDYLNVKVADANERGKDIVCSFDAGRNVDHEAFILRWKTYG